MRYLAVNRQNWNQPSVRKQSAFFGAIQDITPLRKTRHLLIVGAHHSGKTRILHKLYEEAEAIWGKQVQPYAYTSKKRPKDKPMLKRHETLESIGWRFPEPVLLGGVNPLCQWTAHDGIAAWWEAKTPDTPYRKVPAWKKPELIRDYLRDTRAVLFVDDAHKLTGRKLTLTKSYFGAAFRAVITADDENRIHPSLRVPLLESEPQIVRLDTHAAYDATNMLMLFMILASFLAGSSELAMLLGGFHLLSGGRRAGKQD